ncbi:diguanylate cyclase [Lysinibacillus sp. NPDC096418]|uniref:sensor domain-containing diguanylate cyclase n=1 Tax=Lysinibacillus sp. NPDC096418 TaxID=3364138 RepID=UPI003806377C
MKIFINLNFENTIKSHLRRWLIVITIIISLFIFIPTLYIEYRQTMEQQDGEMTNYLDAQAYFFDSWVTERAMDIHMIASLDFIKNYNYDESITYFKEFKKNTEFTDLVFVNKEGIVQFDTATEYSKNGVGVDVTDREYFQVAKKTKEPHITDIIISKVTEQPIVAFASPILNEEQQFNGVIFGTINLNTVDHLLHESRVGFLGRAYVVNQDGLLLTEVNPKKQNIQDEMKDDLSQNFLIDEQALALAKDGSVQSAARYKNANGDWVIAKSQPINQEKWYIISELNIWDAYMPMVKKFILLTICILLGSFFTIKTMLYITRKIEEPVQQLLEGVGNVEKGYYDYKIDENQIAPYAIEFQELCWAFNQMSAKVEADTILLKELSITCQLTKLYNRRYLLEYGESVFAECKKNDDYCSCLAIDIDFFKKVNDTYGHLIGDEVLKHVAEIMMKSVRDTDVVTRYGGEEFIILAPNTSLESAKKIAERIRNAIETNPYEREGKCIYITVSIGIAESIIYDNVPKVEALIDQADQALYVAKESGRNQLKVYENAKEDFLFSN